MGKVQILAVLTMDGCQSSELCCKAYKELRLEDCGINKIRENALYHNSSLNFPGPKRPWQ